LEVVPEELLLHNKILPSINMRKQRAAPCGLLLFYEQSCSFFKKKLDL
jgi:hypothetical protein